MFTPEGAILSPMQRQKLQVKLSILTVLTDLVQKRNHTDKERGMFLQGTKY